MGVLLAIDDFGTAHRRAALNSADRQAEDDRTS